MAAEAYCVVGTLKYHSEGEMGSSFKHNHRKIECRSADPELIHLNEAIIPMNEEYTDYNDAFKKICNSMGIEPMARNVKTFEVCCKSNKKLSGKELEGWKEKTKEWLEDTFGKDRIIEAVYHGDESDWQSHIHAIIIPTFWNNTRGEYILSAKRFLDGADKLAEYHTSYAEYVKDYGLKRGEEGLKADYKTINKLKEETQKDSQRHLDLPEQDEDIYSFYNRVNDQYVGECMRHGYDVRNAEVDAAKTVNRMMQERDKALEQAEKVQSENEILRSQMRLEKEENERLKVENAALRKKAEADGMSENDIKNWLSLKKVLWSLANGIEHPDRILEELDRGCVYHDWNNKPNRMRGDISR